MAMVPRGLEHGLVQLGVGSRRDLDDDVHSRRSDPTDLVGGVRVVVVDDVVGACATGQLSFRLTADGGDDRRAGPAGQLDGRVADRAGPAGDQDGAVSQRARLQPGRAVLRDRQRAVGGRARDPDARPELEVRAVREREDTFGRHDRVLLGGPACRAPVARRASPRRGRRPGCRRPLAPRRRRSRRRRGWEPSARRASGRRRRCATSSRWD